MSPGVGQEPSGVAGASFAVASDFTLPTLDGDQFTLADHAGGPVFPFFWASWCTVCQSHAPVIQGVWPDYEQAGYTFVGVNILDEHDARAFMEGYRLSFPNVQDGDGRVYLDYGSTGYRSRSSCDRGCSSATNSWERSTSPPSDACSMLLSRTGGRRDHPR